MSEREIEAAARAIFGLMYGDADCPDNGLTAFGMERVRDRFIAYATAALAAAAAVRSGPESVEPAGWEPLNMNEIIEVGRAILPYIDSEKTQNVGAIAHDAAVTVMNILRARAAAPPSQEHQTT